MRVLHPVLFLVDTRAEYGRVFDIYVPIAVGVFAVVVAAVLFAVLRYRRRPPERAARFSQHNRAEGAFALLLALTVAFLLYVTFGAEHNVDTATARERPQLTVDVLGAKWEWRFEYPEYGIVRYSGTVGGQHLVVPAGEPIRFRLATADVIHAFWVPELRFKHDLDPGSVQEATLVFSRTGSYPGECAEFCGLYHSRMLFDVDVVAAPRFLAWARARGAGPAP